MRTFQVILIGAVLLFEIQGSHAADGRTDLRGRVTETNGAPLTKATVFIYTAGPKVGTSPFCPYCYADCQKKALTDGEGRFKIASLDRALIFRLLVAANGHESRIVPRVDPAKGETKIALKTLCGEELNPKRQIRGRVIGGDGKPVASVVISTEGVDMGEEGQWGGTDDYVEPLAAADEAGRLVLYCKSDKVTMVHGLASGRGVARQWVSLKPGAEEVIRMQEGVMVTGKVVREGKPVEGAMVGLVTTARRTGEIFHGDEAATDANGIFRIMDVPPDREFVLFSEMTSLGGGVALPNKVFRAGHSGTVNELGELALQGAYKVAGRILLSDHKSIPVGTSILLNRDNVWDSLEMVLDGDGRFEFRGVPAERVSLSVEIAGYRFARKNPSLDWFNGDVAGQVKGNVTNLNFVMEPGEWHYDEEAAEAHKKANGNAAEEPLRGTK